MGSVERARKMPLDHFLCPSCTCRMPASSVSEHCRIFKGFWCEEAPYFRPRRDAPVQGYQGAWYSLSVATRGCHPCRARARERILEAYSCCPLPVLGGLLQFLIFGLLLDVPSLKGQCSFRFLCCQPGFHIRPYLSDLSENSFSSSPCLGPGH